MEKVLFRCLKASLGLILLSGLFCIITGVNDNNSTKFYFGLMLLIAPLLIIASFLLLMNIEYICYKHSHHLRNESFRVNKKEFRFQEKHKKSIFHSNGEKLKSEAKVTESPKHLDYTICEDK